jgi:hypothetical protein
MKFKQNLSLLFWLYRGKASKDGKAPIYVRITIDGTDTDISLGKKIHPDFWNSDAKQVTATTSEAKMINLKIVQAQAEIEKHFLVLQSQFEYSCESTPAFLSKGRQKFLGKVRHLKVA